MWNTYDVDKSGSLDKEETKKFIKDTLVRIKPDHDLSDEIFDKNTTGLKRSFIDLNFQNN